MERPDQEIREDVTICDETGALNREAIGWARRPHWISNLQGRFPRKKQWDYWCFVGPERLFSVCVAHVDYIGLVGAYVLEYATGRMGECGMIRPFARQPQMPPRTHGETVARYGRIHAEQQLTPEGGTITFAAPNCQGHPLEAELHVSFPAALDTLNVLVPWSDKHFQFTSKQLPLPAHGTVRWGDEVWNFDADTCFGVRDFGRGIWPYRTRWNWAAISAREGDQHYGINLGGQWTDGTDATENGLILNGVLHKIHEDVVFECDHRDHMKPWRLHTPGSKTVDLELTPFFDRHSHVNLGIFRTSVHQCFGHFRGAVNVDGNRVDVKEALGWAEEHHARW